MVGDAIKAHAEEVTAHAKGETLRKGGFDGGFEDADASMVEGMKAVQHFAAPTVRGEDAILVLLKGLEFNV